MAKKKKKSKKSKTEKQSSSLTPPPLAPRTTARRNNLNPFFIEPSSIEDGVGDWRTDDGGDLEQDLQYEQQDMMDQDLVEHESLLPSDNLYPPTDNGRRQHHQHRRRRRGRSGVDWRLSPRIVVAFTGIFLLFFVLLSMMESETDTTPTKQSTTGSHNATIVLPPNEPIPSSREKDSIDTSSSQASNDDTDTSPTTKDDSENSSSQDGTEPESIDNTGDVDPDSPSSQFPTLVVVGERHSGVDYVFHQVLQQQCGYYHGLKNGLTRPAYWFQYDNEGISVDPNRSYIFIYVVRNPYTWVEAMRLHPNYHWHYNRTNGPSQWAPWDPKTFLTTPWTVPANSPTMDGDLLSSSGQQPTESKRNTPSEPSSCQFGFTSQQVVPCQSSLPESTSLQERSLQQAVYELNISSLEGPEGHHSTAAPYDNLLKLRAAKIRHTWAFADSVRGNHDNNVIVVKYEDLNQPYTWVVQPVQHLLASQYDVNLNEQDWWKCKQPQSVRPFVFPQDTLSTDPDPAAALATIPTPYIKSLTRRIDWAAEFKLFYFPVQTWNHS